MVKKKGKLPDAPSRDLVEGVVVLADISGFTKLGEKLIEENGDAKGAEEFAKQVSDAISVLVVVIHKYEGEIVKIAGDCLICLFANKEDGEEDEDEAAIRNAKLCAIELLKVVKIANESLDLHGGVAPGQI